jgi:protein-arginine kinase activator protein McsA
MGGNRFEGDGMNENLICPHCLQTSMEFVSDAIMRGDMARVYYCKNCKKGIVVKET